MEDIFSDDSPQPPHIFLLKEWCLRSNPIYLTLTHQSTHQDAPELHSPLIFASSTSIVYKIYSAYLNQLQTETCMHRKTRLLRPFEIYLLWEFPEVRKQNVIKVSF